MEESNIIHSLITMGLIGVCALIGCFVLALVVEGLDQFVYARRKRNKIWAWVHENIVEG